MDEIMKDGEQPDVVNNSLNTEAVKQLFFQYLCFHVCHTALWANILTN